MYMHMQKKIILTFEATIVLFSLFHVCTTVEILCSATRDCSDTLVRLITVEECCDRSAFPSAFGLSYTTTENRSICTECPRGKGKKGRMHFSG